MWGLPTVMTSTMIAYFDGKHKVRCHKGVVDFWCVATHPSPGRKSQAFLEKSFRGTTAA
jgi:hypothetical protein